MPNKHEFIAWWNLAIFGYRQKLTSIINKVESNMKKWKDINSIKISRIECFNEISSPICTKDDVVE